MLIRLLRATLAATIVALPLNLIAIQTGVGACALLVVGGIAGGTMTYRRTPLDLPLGFFLLALIASFLAAEQPVHSFFSSTSFWVYLGFFVFSQAIPAVGGISTLRGPIVAAVTLAAAVSCFAIYQHFTGSEVAFAGHRVTRPPFSADRFVAVAQFHRHTTLAFMLMTAVIVVASLVVETFKTRRIAALGLLAFPMLVAMFFSYVRMAWIGLVAALTVLGFFRTWKIVSAALIVFVVAGSVATLASPSVLTKINMLLSADDTGRSYVWARTAEMLRDNPAAGIGYGNFTPVAKRYYDDTPDTRMLPRCHAHNIFLHYWCETGPAGLFGFLMFLTAFFATTVPALRRAPPGAARVALSASVATVAGIAAGSVAQDVMFDGQIAFSVVLLMAVGVSAAGEAGNVEPEDGAAPPSPFVNGP